MTMTPEVARDLWASLAEHGRPEVQAAEAIPIYTVGIDPWIERLTKTYLQDLSRRHAHFKLVLAPYGGGKTHFLLSLRNRARIENFAVAYVQCRPEVSLSTPLEMYREIVRTLTLPSEDRSGLVALLRRVAVNKREQIRRVGPPDPEAAFDAWLGSVLEDDHPELAFGRVVVEALRSLDATPGGSVDDAAVRWLRGEIDTLTKEELAQLKLAKPTRAQQVEIGRNLLWSILRFAREAGVHGTLLLLDEVETLFTARGKALQRILSAMRVLIDQPTQFLGGVPSLCVCAAVPDILGQLRNYQALEQRVRVIGGTFEEGADRSPQIDLSRVGNETELLTAMGEKLLNVGALALGRTFDSVIQQDNLQRLARIAVEYSLEISVRRIFVRTWVNILDLQHLQGERKLGDEELRRRYRGEFEALRSQEPQEENP